MFSLWLFIKEGPIRTFISVDQSEIWTKVHLSVFVLYTNYKLCLKALWWSYSTPLFKCLFELPPCSPVLIEVPHYASLRGKEREVVILRSDNGETWYEHPMQATEEAVHESLGASAEGDLGPKASQPDQASLWSEHAFVVHSTRNTRISNVEDKFKDEFKEK